MTRRPRVWAHAVRDHPPSTGPVVVGLIAVSGVAVFARAVLLLFPDLPPTGRDEVLFAQPAVELLRHGKLATPLLTDVLPGVDERTYWMPPLYFLVLAGTFAVAGPGPAPMRTVSLLSAATVLVLTYIVARRYGLSRTMAVLPIAILAADPVFVRASLFGRMDMLTLALMLVALLLIGGHRASSRTVTGALSGAAAGLAALTHPFAIAMLPVFIAHKLRLRGGYDLRAPAMGYAIVIVPWILYAAQDVAAFRAQLVSQFLFKGSHSGVERLGHNVMALAAQYPDQPWGPVTALAIPLAVVALAVRARSDPSGTPPAVLLAGALVLQIATPSLWYAVYITPLMYVGLTLAIGRSGGRLGRTYSALTIAVLLLTTSSNVSAVDALVASNGGPAEQRSAFATWTARVSDALPVGSRVLVSADPDPSFVLLARGDLRISWLFDEPSLLPRYEEILDRFDHLLLAGSPEIVGRGLARSHGQEIAVIEQSPGSPQRECYLGGGPMCPFAAHVYTIRP